jgi:hypothetical protein
MLPRNGCIGGSVRDDNRGRFSGPCENCIIYPVTYVIGSFGSVENAIANGLIAADD